MLQKSEKSNFTLALDASQPEAPYVLLSVPDMSHSAAGEHKVNEALAAITVVTVNEGFSWIQQLSTKLFNSLQCKYIATYL